MPLFLFGPRKKKKRKKKEILREWRPWGPGEWMTLKVSIRAFFVCDSRVNVLSEEGKHKLGVVGRERV